MSLKKQIIALVSDKPGLDSNQIAEQLGAKITSVKVTLCKLINTETVTRIKEPKTDKQKAGRVNTFRYKIKSD